MIFAAGFGTRMGALTQDRPKPLIKVAGKPLIDHAMDQAAGVPLRSTVVNAHYRADQITDHLRDRHGVSVSVEAPDILDTGGGLKRALPMLDAPAVFALNSDAVWRGPNALGLLAAAWQPEVMDCLMLLVPLGRTHGRTGGGDAALTDGKVTFGGEMVFTGAQILKTGVVADDPRRVFSLKDTWLRLAEQGRLSGIEYSGHWADVGHPAGIEEAERMLRGDG